MHGDLMAIKSGHQGTRLTVTIRAINWWMKCLPLNWMRRASHVGRILSGEAPRGARGAEFLRVAR